MITNFYIDESGSSGGLARPGAHFAFGGQQIFVLACLGVDDESALAAELVRLKKHYRIQSPEMKSSSVEGKERLMTELAAFIRTHQLPMMIELVDKRFMIATNILMTLVLPPIDDINFMPENQWMINLMAEYIHENAPLTAFEAYAAACDAPSPKSVTSAFQSMLEWLEPRSRSEDIAEALHRGTAKSFGEFLQAGPENEAAQRRVLPMPDVGKRGQSISMLPNLSSLTNIYARINQLRAGRIADVTLIHDEQAHFDAILLEAKAMTEELVGNGLTVPFPHADYRFKEKASLRFVKSQGHPGIQAADLLAGFMMRSTKAVLYNGETLQPETVEAFQAITAVCEPTLGIGVNFVLSTADLERLPSSA
ncbi:DUF3800 domain-containing protein [Archangium primigenium]|uniref:DUF3800 domain-containing protein n=1 Tax=[Archangium] primigenium TaxID=2792470 RepID=UPI00195C6ACD|nr:DUF3800 domain-containing protein [Archangium primigenium]